MEIDVAAVKGRLECDDDLLIEIWEAFCEDAPQLLIGLQSALDREDLGTIERHAHSLKGSSANIGADIFRKVASDMELSARRGDLAGTRAMYSPLADGLNRVLEELTGLLALYRTR